MTRRPYKVMVVRLVAEYARRDAADRCAARQAIGPDEKVVVVKEEPK